MRKCGSGFKKQNKKHLDQNFICFPFVSQLLLHLDIVTNPNPQQGRQVCAALVLQFLLNVYRKKYFFWLTY